MKPVVIVSGPLAVASTWGKEVAVCRRGVTPWDHQDQISSFIRSRMGSLVLAQMGTGKTLAFLLAMGLNGDETVEFVDISHGSSHARVKRLAKAREAQAGPLVVFVNHDSVWRKAVSDALLKLGGDVIGIAFDESHKIKSPSSKVSRWAAKARKHFPKARRVALTGTPCPNNPLDVYGQLRFADFAAMRPVDTFAAFKSRMCAVHPDMPGMILRWYPDGTNWLRRVVAGCSVQLKADDVLKDRPAEIHQQIDVKLSPATARFYRDLERDFVAGIDAGEVSVQNALTLSTRLRQATGGQTNFEGLARRIHPDEADKRRVLEDILDGLDEPVVVFTSFVSDMEETAAACRKLGRTFSELSGRSKQLEQWQRGDTDVIGVQITAGGAGVDLSRSRVAIYYSPLWSLGDFDQSLARIRRPGQKSSHCLYLHLVAVGTIDEVMHKALRSKQKVVDAVVDGLASNSSRSRGTVNGCTR